MPGKNKKQHKTTRRKATRTKSKTKKASKSAKGKTVVAAVLDSQKLQSLYATMLRAHILNQRVWRILSAGGEGAFPATTGREAVMAGAIAHTLPGDSIAAARDSFLASFIRGSSLKSILEQLTAEDLRLAAAAEHKDPASLAAVAVTHGMALAVESKGKLNVVLIFPGEQHTATAYYDALNLSAKDRLPLVCMAETASSDAEQPPIGVEAPAIVRNFPQITVDGTDVVAIFRVTQEAVRRARSGHGPSLIECVMPGQAPTPAAEEMPATLVFMRQYLQRRSLWSEEWQQEIAREFELELNAAIASASGEHGNFGQMEEPDRPAARSPHGLELT